MLQFENIFEVGAGQRRKDLSAVKPREESRNDLLDVVEQYIADNIN